MSKRKITKKTRPQRDEIVEKPVKRSAGNFHIEFKNDQQKKAWQTIEQNEITFLIGPAGSAKSFISSAYACSSILTKRQQKILLTRPIVEATASIGFLPGPQPLTAKIVTPTGWTTMGELKVGDKVIGRDGLPTEVLEIYPKGEKDIYRITTTDGTQTECCLDHLWYTETFENKKRNKKGTVKTTQEIIDTLKTKDGKPNHYLPRNEAIHYEKQNHELSPYVMGVLLGDGSIGNSISFASADMEIVNRVEKEIKALNLTLTEHEKKYSKANSYTISSHNYSWKPARKIKVTNTNNGQQMLFERNQIAADYYGIKKETLRSRCMNGSTIKDNKFEYLNLENKFSHPIKNIMNSYNLLHKKAWEKFIPDHYKYSSIKDRLDILRGLMDTDGTVTVRKGYSEASFTTTSKQLANDVIEIVRSLGGRACLRERNRINKKSKLIDGRKIVCRRKCYEFTISLPENLNPFYLSRKAEKFKCNYIYKIGIANIEKVGHEEVQCIKVDNPEHLYLTDNFIVTHNTFEEKVNPYITPIYDALDELVGPVGFQREIVNKSIQIRPLNYMRGCNFNDAICLHDEAQNNDFKSLLLYITRLGRNSKMIINGDPYQVDIKNSALMEVINKLEGLPGIGVVRFDKSAIVRNPLISQILDRLAPEQSI